MSITFETQMSILNLLNQRLLGLKVYTLGRYACVAQISDLGAISTFPHQSAVFRAGVSNDLQYEDLFFSNVTYIHWNYLGMRIFTCTFNHTSRFLTIPVFRKV